jgi:hypothetical protein
MTGQSGGLHVRPERRLQILEFAVEVALEEALDAGEFAVDDELVAESTARLGLFDGVLAGDAHHLRGAHEPDESGRVAFDVLGFDGRGRPNQGDGQRHLPRRLVGLGVDLVALDDADGLRASSGVRDELPDCLRRGVEFERSADADGHVTRLREGSKKATRPSRR